MKSQVMSSQTQRIKDLLVEFNSLTDNGYTQVYIKQDLNTGKVYIIPVGKNNEDGSSTTYITDIVIMLNQLEKEGYSKILFSEAFNEETSKYYLVINPVREDEHEPYTLNIDELSMN